MTCIRGDRVIFRNLSFSAADGSITVVTGRNGSGKTSLLRAIVGLIPISFGTIKLNNEDISTLNTCISDITYIGHRSACHEHMSTADILELWANMRNNGDLVLAAVQFFGLEQVLNIKFSCLSSGWKKRVALARLLIFNTPVWVMDEPFANLDETSTARVKDLIFTRAERGGIIILSEHSPENIFPDAPVVNLEQFAVEQH